VSELGVWMDWDSKEFREFLVEFYRKQLELADSIGETKAAGGLPPTRVRSLAKK
jgi:hypothetical protein